MPNKYVASAAIIAVAAATSIAAGPSVAQARTPHLYCTTNGPNYYWSAKDPQQAWLPLGPSLGNAQAPGGSLTITKNATYTTSATYTLSSQLGVDAGIDIGIAKIGGSSSITGSVATTSTEGVGVQISQTAVNPLKTPAAPQFFVKGYRLKATLYTLAGGAQHCKFYPRKTKNVYLPLKNPTPRDVIVGWVATESNPHAVALRWSKVPTDG